LLYEVYVGRQKNAGKILLLVKTEIERQTDRLNTALLFLGFFESHGKADIAQGLNDLQK